MTSPDSQERLKEEAKAARERIEKLVASETDFIKRCVRTICIYAGMLTETLVEYEEPDVVMEQALHRVADLLHTDPTDEEETAITPYAYRIDHDTELGRHLARGSAKRLPKGMDDVHEIAIALIINDFPQWEKEGFAKDRALHILIDTVILSLTFEMATQDFCDLLIEEFIANGHSTAEGIIALSALAGYYLRDAHYKAPLPDDAESELTDVMAREAKRHKAEGTRNWQTLSPVNDNMDTVVSAHMHEIKASIDEFFELIGLEDALSQSVALAKAVGRMVAVISIEDIGQLHPSIAKSLAKAGMILGAKYRDQAKAG